jgi:hypothetical protein
LLEKSSREKEREREKKRKKREGREKVVIVSGN